MRDIPRYVKLIEKGKIDATSMITKRYTLETSRQGCRIRPIAPSSPA